MTHQTRSPSNPVRLKRSGRRTGHIDIPGSADALIVKPQVIWVATVIVPLSRTAPA